MVRTKGTVLQICRRQVLTDLWEGGAAPTRWLLPRHGSMPEKSAATTASQSAAVARKQEADVCWVYHHHLFALHAASFVPLGQVKPLNVAR